MGITESEVSVRVSESRDNRLFERKQLVVVVSHPGLATISKADLRKKMAQMYKTSEQHVECFGIKTGYGGRDSVGYVFIYDTFDALKKYEPKHRMIKRGLLSVTKKVSRKARKERKNKNKRYRGMNKTGKKKSKSS